MLKALITEPDERLLVEAAQRDPGCFAELYRNSFDRVYAYVAGRVHSRDEAQDVTAEVFHEALANIHRFEWRGVPFAAWLLRIAKNTLANRWRIANREQPTTVEALNSLAVEDGTERRAMLYKLVDSLPADQREVVLRRFVDGRSVGEIARELGRSEGAVRQLQFRALTTLRNRTRSHHVEQ